MKHKHRLVGQPDRIWLCETQTYRLVRQPDRIWLCETHREIHSVHLVEMWTNYTTAEVKFLPLDSFLVKTNETHRHAHTGEWVLIATCLGGVNWKNKFLLPVRVSTAQLAPPPPPPPPSLFPLALVSPISMAGKVESLSSAQGLACSVRGLLQRVSACLS